MFKSLSNFNKSTFSLNCIRKAHIQHTYLKSDEAIAMTNYKVGTIEMSLWLSRLSNREKNTFIKTTHRIPQKLREKTLFSYLTCASPFRKIKDGDNHYRELLQQLQPDAVILAVEDEFREYLTSPNPFNLSHLNMSIFKMPKYIMNRGFFDGEYDRIYHKMLHVLPYHRNSIPYENYRHLLTHSQDVLGCQIYSGGRFGMNEAGMNIPNYPIGIKLKLAWFWVNHFLNASFVDYTKYRAELNHSIYAVQNNPFYALNNMAKCFNLMASVDHVRTKFKNNFYKIMSADPSIKINMDMNRSADLQPEEPVILVVAPPHMCDLLLGKTDFLSLPAPDYDREDTDLYELADNCLDSPDLLKNDFLKQLKYKSSVIAPLVF